MKKIDYKKELNQFYNASPNKIEIVEVPKMNFLMIDGEGDPNTSKHIMMRLKLCSAFPMR